VLGIRVLAALIVAMAVAPAWAHDPRIPASRVDRLDVVPTAVAPTRPSEIASPVLRSGLEPVRPLGARSAPGVAEMIAVLIVALGLAGFGESWRRDHRAALAAATAGILLGFVAESTPHLVHHGLDADQGASCQVLQAAERDHAAVGALDVAPASAPAYLDERPIPAPLATLSAPAPCGRAPPV
jgi:hypothetical protein